MLSVHKVPPCTCCVANRNVIQLFEVIDSPKQIFLIMEYSDGGELFDYIVKHKRIPEPVAAAFMHDICAGVDYLHSVNVIHRDLKPENLLMQRIGGSYRIKVCSRVVHKTSRVCCGHLFSGSCGGFTAVTPPSQPPRSSSFSCARGVAR